MSLSVQAFGRLPMNLAKSLLTSVLLVTASATGWSEQAQQSAPTEPSPNPQLQKEKPAAQPSAKAKSTTSEPGKSANRPSNAVSKSRRKKKHLQDCSVTPDPAASTATGSPESTGAAVNPQASNTPSEGSSAAKKCPPPKIVVHQGGTSEPAIQLAGGAPSQTPQARATAEPMLDATESNLKKLEGRQLSSSEQEMVTQIQQYVEQSKTAVAAGDVERARTLAWKAQTLSEDLVKPEKQ